MSQRGNIEPRDTGTHYPRHVGVDLSYDELSVSVAVKGVPMRLQSKHDGSPGYTIKISRRD